ncbi:DUF342 domain-containing protein [Agaribacter marinus]|uniref:Flagellar Assembly Protein A N-terminal region domain-containing protein n=1 Tax=Agaribacter marinus TaxID=1431249 RepID=A0AA37T1Z4_9ALTE|nr:FapA family protein [Agaribacter marinus]GLR70165.1 hypothetical protein GCM10007852_10730 [Agaribacter marinus]
MKGVTFSENTEKMQLDVEIDPLLIEDVLKADVFINYIKTTSFAAFYILKNSIQELVGTVNTARDEGKMNMITWKIGEYRDAELSTHASKDHMSVEITITSAYKGDTPDLEDVIDSLNRQGVVRGISKKRIQRLVNASLESEPGSKHSDIVAIGLPPRRGKSSHIIPLVQNALDRILSPRQADKDKVNMRDLGEIICVPVGTAVARRVAPTNGRVGFTVKNHPVNADPGEWHHIKLGQNTTIDKDDENIIRSTVAGLPKFEKLVMNIDDTFVTEGVNVKTGNVHYKGAVIVNGDVTEQMQIIADGDVTVNGFVESALIKAGGDIIITHGATGKMDEDDCQLYADGNIFIQHGQGLDIVVDKNLTVKKQLAYSKVKCKGSITIGDPKKPRGKLFASKINCAGIIRAGCIGAISGSSLEIDYSEAYNKLCGRVDAIGDLLKDLQRTNANHEIRMTEVHGKRIHNALLSKLTNLTDKLESERVLLDWLRNSEKELREAKVQYEESARVLAYQEMYPGVTIKLNNRIWKAEKEYLRSRIAYEGRVWKYEPII